MPAAHKKTYFQPLDVPNPFKEGQDHAYADILLLATGEAKAWRRSSIIIILLFAVSLIVNIISISQQNVVPVLVNVMPSGESQFLGEVRSGNYQIPEASVQYEIRKFVSNLRTVSTDYQIVYNNIAHLFEMAARDYSPVLRQMLLSDSPFELVGKIRRTVEIESVLNITGRSYNINWTEHSIDSSSRTTSSKYRAVATIRIAVPTADTVVNNPSGVYIENFEMTELK